MLLWGIANSRPDTVALALERGADPNTTLHRNQYIPDSYCRTIRTPVDAAIRMRVHSPDAESHALKLETLALLLAAGGTCIIDSLTIPTSYGDLDLLTLCLEHLEETDIYPGKQYVLQTILYFAVCRGHAEAARMMIGAGAIVNSTGRQDSSGFYPPLWVCWGASIILLQVLLDAGADADWRDSHGVSVVHRIRKWSGSSLDVDDKVALLVRYGAVDEPPLWPPIGVRVKRRRPHIQWHPQWVPSIGEYRGWVPGIVETLVGWEPEWVLAGRGTWCGCLSCPIQVPGEDRSGALEVMGWEVGVRWWFGKRKRGEEVDSVLSWKSASSV